MDNATCIDTSLSSPNIRTKKDNLDDDLNEHIVVVRLFSRTLLMNSWHGLLLI